MLKNNWFEGDRDINVLDRYYSFVMTSNMRYKHFAKYDACAVYDVFYLQKILISIEVMKMKVKKC